jgi:hypothetical protein
MREVTIAALGEALPAMTESVDGQAQLASANRMADLLRRYPLLLPQQKDELLLFLKEGDRAAVGEIARRPGLEPRLICVPPRPSGAFQDGVREHRSRVVHGAAVAGGKRLDHPWLTGCIEAFDQLQ